MNLFDTDARIVSFNLLHTSFLLYNVKVLSQRFSKGWYVVRTVENIKQNPLLNFHFGLDLLIFFSILKVFSFTLEIYTTIQYRAHFHNTFVKKYPKMYEK